MTIGYISWFKSVCLFYVKMPSCFDCAFHVAEKNMCLAWGTAPAMARRYPHLCGANGDAFRPIVLVQRPPPKKDEMYKPEPPAKFDF